MPFEVPEGWEWVRLEDFVYAVTDGDHLPPPKSPSGVPFLVISDVNTGRISFDKARYAEKEYYEALPEIRKAVIGDILFTVTGSYGIVIPVDTEQKFCFQRHIGLIKTLTSSPWLTIALQSDYVSSYCDKVATGTAQKTVSLAHLRNLLIPIPPHKEQERINEELSKWLDAVNDISSNNEKLSCAIDKTKSKILDLAIHGKLVPQDPNDEPAIDLLKRINPNFTPCDNAHYGNIPTGWTLATVKDIGELLSGRDLMNDECNTENRGLPYLIGASNIEGNIISFNRWTEKPQVISQMGDMLISCKGTIGAIVKNSIGEIHIARQFMAIRPNTTCITSGFLHICLIAIIEEIKKDARGVIPGISRDDILTKFFPIPPLNEQRKIVSAIQEHNVLLDSISANL